MIPHPSTGVQPWANQPHVLSGGSGGSLVSPRTSARSASLAGKPLTAASQSQSRQPYVIDLIGTNTDSEHQARKSKYDSSTCVDDKAVAKAGEWRNGGSTARTSTLPSRGRPACSFQELIVETYGGSVHGGNPAAGSQALISTSPPPFPTRPWKGLFPEPPVNGLVSQEGTPEREVLTTPYRLEVPSIAPVLKHDKVADFSPWTGHHPEDVLNEQTTKHGYYDRTQVSQNESNSARPSLYLQLKYRSGLQVLSSVFAATLEKRQAHSKVAAASTFKPPPRVTLTDNKREAWLRDLANPSVPLRRLSRTIPHGIRGKVLLDQCLSKWIPIGRAVWLAKCVGANEIRAFKRKGTSGAVALGLEVKWVRDWTTSVQLFIEGVIGTCGTADWKMKMTYVVRLAARLFFENLLDQDCYLEWFLCSLESASTDSLPIWLLMLGIFWDHLMRYRKRGRRLAEVLLEKLKKTTITEPKDALRPLIDRLSCLIRKLIYQQPSSVVIPRSWDDYHDLVSSCLNLEHPVDRAIFQTLADRNARVQQAKHYRRTGPRSSQQRIIQALDTARSDHDINTLFDACLGITGDQASLISKFFEWAATPFRHGLVRVYIAVRLLRKWKKTGTDIDSYILSYLRTIEDSAKLDMDNIYHVIAELVRSHSFSVAKYLQWLVARGAVGYSRHSKPKSVSKDVELLSQLPMSRLPQHVQNLRNTLLARAGLSPSERSLVEAIKADIQRKLPGIFGAFVGQDIPMIDNFSPKDLTWTIKSEVGQWIRRGIADHYNQPARYMVEKRSLEAMEISCLTAKEFFTIRSILESLEDLSMLADVLNDAANCDDVIVLASAVDTLNYHFDSFSVIGAMNDLFRRFFDAFVRVKHSGLPLHDLVFSLVELGLRLRDEANTVIVLRQELARLDRRTTLAAPSPVSDHMVETLNFSSSSSSENLNQLLTSGSTMDEATLVIIFKKLSRLLEVSDGEKKLSRNDICRYLAQLRFFNAKKFDLLLIRWTEGMLKSSARPKLSKILAPLIGTGCVTLPAFFSLLRRLLHPEPSRSAVPNLLELRLDLVELLVPRARSSWAPLDLLTYRFRVAQQEFFLKQHEEILGVINDAAASLAMQASRGLKTGVSSLYHCVTALLGDLIVQHPESVAGRCARQLMESYPTIIDVLQQTLNLLLGLPDTTDSLTEAEKAISMVNDFSLPFCQLKLQLLFDTASREEVKDAIIDKIFKAAVADIQAGKSHWVDLVALANQDAVHQIRQRAEKGFLSLTLPDGIIEDEFEDGITKFSFQDTAKVYMRIIDGLAYSIPQVGMPSIAPLLMEKMNMLLQKLILVQTNSKNSGENRSGMISDQAMSTFEGNFTFWFTALLHMVVLHRSAFDTLQSTSQRPSALLDQSRLLIAVCCIALSRFPASLMSQAFEAGYLPPYMSIDQQLRAGNSLQTYAFDVAACLVDTLPDEARQQCARFLKDRCPPLFHVQNEPRLLYLLGPTTDPSVSTSLQPISAPSPATSGPVSSSIPSTNPLAGSAPVQNLSSPTVATPTGATEEPVSIINRLRVQRRGRVVGPYFFRPWEMLEEAAPVVGANDTAIDLGYFGARKARE